MDDNPRDPQGVRDALRSVTDISQLHFVVNSQDAVAYLRREPPFGAAPTPDVIVVAVNPPAHQGRVALEQIRHVDLHPPVIILADATNGPASSYLNAGAADYVVREDGLSQLCRSVETVVATRAALKQLTHRQIEVLRRIGEGRSTKEIAVLLRISAKTVEAHRADLMRRLEVKTVAALVHIALSTNLLEVGPPRP